MMTNKDEINCDVIFAIEYQIAVIIMERIIGRHFTKYVVLGLQIGIFSVCNAYFTFDQLRYV